MNYSTLLKKITQLCAEMISTGGSCEEIPLRMNYICNKYGLSESEFIVNPNIAVATATTPEGKEISAISSIASISPNFGKLNRLDKYCNTIINELPTAEEIEQTIKLIEKEEFISKPVEFLATIMFGVGFGIVFGCNLKDVIVSIVSCVLIVLIGSEIKKLSGNAFVFNAIVCLVVESVILFAYHTLGFCEHPEAVTLGIIMIIISGLNYSDGMWYLMTKNTSMGVYKICNSVIGAIGIVVGIAGALILFKTSYINSLVLNESLLVQVLFSAVACGGFAIVCCIEKKHLPLVALGGGLSWLVYSVAAKFIPSLFLSMAVAALVTTSYTIFISHKFKTNRNIAYSVAILSLVPGSNLFYMLGGIVMQDNNMEIVQFTKLIATCLGISFGCALGRILFDRPGRKLKKNASK